MFPDDHDLLGLAPEELARLVKQAPARQLRALLQGEGRSAMLTELVRRMPDAFRADRAGGLRAVIHWRIGDRPDGGHDAFQLSIANGACVVCETVDRIADLTLSIGAVEFLQMVTGNAHPVALVMRGKLRSKGDIALTATFPRLFDVPTV